MAWFHLVASLPPSHSLNPLSQRGGRKKSEFKKKSSQTLPNYPHGQNRLGLGDLICFRNTCKEGNSRKFNWNIKKNFFTVQVVEHWIRLPRDGVDFPSLVIFKTHSLLMCSSGLTVPETGDKWLLVFTSSLTHYHTLLQNLQPVKVFDHSFSKDIRPDIQSKPLLNKLTSSSSCHRNREA